MQDFNYDNTNSLLILGSVALFMALYFVRMTLWNGLVWHASVYSEDMRKHHKELLNQLFWKEPFMITLGAINPIVMSAVINL